MLHRRGSVRIGSHRVPLPIEFLQPWYEIYGGSGCKSSLASGRRRSPPRRFWHGEWFRRQAELDLPASNSDCLTRRLEICSYAVQGSKRNLGPSKKDRRAKDSTLVVGIHRIVGDSERLKCRRAGRGKRINCCLAFPACCSSGHPGS